MMMTTTTIMIMIMIMMTMIIWYDDYYDDYDYDYDNSIDTLDNHGPRHTYHMYNGILAHWGVRWSKYASDNRVTIRLSNGLSPVQW